MKLTFAIALVLLALASAQNCDNPLLQVFNLEGLNSPISVSNSSVCRNLQENQSCCSANTLLTFQGLIDSMTSSLQKLAGSRDIYIAQLNSNYTDRYRDQVSDLTDYDGDINDIQDANAAVGDPIKTQYESFKQLSSELNDIDDSDNYKSDFVDMQNKRVTCLTTLLQFQAEILCLACDPTWESQGVAANGTVTAAAAVCNTIQEACAPFSAAMDKFNPLYQAQQTYNRLVGMTDWVKFYHDNDVFPNATLSGDVFNSTNATERTNTFPANCSEDSCTWQCGALFSGSFELNQTVAANGAGIIGGGDFVLPDIGVTVQTPSGTRRLQQSTGTWNPDLTNSQITVAIVADPAAVTNLDGSDASDADINDHLDGFRTTIIGALLVILPIFSAILF